MKLACFILLTKILMGSTTESWPLILNALLLHDFLLYNMVKLLSFPFAHGILTILLIFQISTAGSGRYGVSAVIVIGALGYVFIWWKVLDHVHYLRN